jgi:polygalacturonase
MRGLSRLGLIVALSAGWAAAADVNVRDCGAVGDGAATDTQAVQAAIDRCAASGGGVVVVPAGGRYVCGSLFLKSGVTLRVEKGATILGSEEKGDYPMIDTRIAGLEMKHPAALVNAIDCQHVGIDGGGVIAGRGKVWWDWFWKTREERGRGVDFQVHRPRLVCFTRCQGVKVSGVTLKDPAFWTLHLLYSKDVDVEGITVRAPKKAASSDGIDVDSSSDVRIRRCDISCDDDDIALKAGRDADGLRVNRPTENVTIEDCKVGMGAGVAMGSETAGGIRHVVVRNCAFDGSGAAARLKSYPGRGGVVEDIRFENLDAKNVKTAVNIDMTWGGSDWKKFVEPRFAADTGERGVPRFRDILVKNLKARGAASAGVVRGLKSSRVEGVVFENVDIEAKKGLVVENVGEMDLSGLRVKVSEGEEIIRRD